MAEDNWLDPFQHVTLPFADWMGDAIEWMVTEYRPMFRLIREPFDFLLKHFDAALTSVPPLVMLCLIFLLAWQMAGRRTAIGVTAAMTFLGLLHEEAWALSMTTLSIVLVAVFTCMLVGLPLGVLAARSKRFKAVFWPLLDTMQTIPAFAYLIPVVMLFGIGNVPGVIVTSIFALPPLIRLTCLGIQQVPSSVVEAAQAFGARPSQILFKVQIPLARPTIMAGVNQCMLMSLSMVVVASMIAVNGLGREVLRAIGRLDVGLAAVGGLGIVILAIVLDRITQGMGRSARERGYRHWYEGGPIGLLRDGWRHAFAITRKHP